MSQQVVNIEDVIMKRIREMRERERTHRVLCVELPTELYEKLTLIAQSNDVDRERLVVELIKSYVESYYRSVEQS